jgi:hypothetical protein
MACVTAGGLVLSSNNRRSLQGYKTGFFDVKVFKVSKAGAGCA